MGTKSDQFSTREAKERFEAALRGGMGTSPKPHNEMKLGKPRNKKTKASTKRKAKR
jgi:hypothetical protein